MSGSTPSPGASRRHPLLLIALALPLILGAWYARQIADSIIGPLAIAASDSEVAVAAPGLLYRLSANGALQSTDADTISPDALDAGLDFHAGFLLASPGPDGELLRCEGGDCKLFSENNWAPKGPVQVHFDSTHFWFSETDADRIQRYGVDGSRIDMPLSDLNEPGSLYVDGERLFVANSGAGKIQRHKLHKRGIDEAEDFATYRTGPVDNPVSIPRRLLAAGDGGFKAIFSDARRQNAVLVDIDRYGDATPAAIEGLVNPVDLAWQGDALLILDEGLMQVLKLETDGTISVFGDDDFQAQLAEKESLRYALRNAAPALFWLGIAALSVGGAWLLLVLTHREVDPAMTVQPDVNGILWLPAECDLAPRRIPRYVLVAAPLALAPAGALMLVTPWQQAAMGWAAVVLAIAVSIPMMAAARANLPKGERIGIRDRQLIVTHPERGMREFPLPRVEWNEFLLRPQSGLEIPLARGSIPLYHVPTIEAELLPRLNLMRKIVN